MTPFVVALRFLYDGIMLATMFLMIQVFLYKDLSADQLIRGAMRANYDLQLEDSRKLTSTLQENYPDHPAGYLLAAESYWWEAQADPKNKKIEESY